MNSNFFVKSERVKAFLLLFSLLGFFAASASAALEGSKDVGTVKAREVISAAIKAMGGERYKNAKTVHSYGRHFVFDRQGRKAFAYFWDWSVFEPIKSRAQYGKGQGQEVWIHNLELGQAWKLEGKDSVERLTEKEIEDFKKRAKKDMDILLRTRLDEEDMSLFYYGPEDIAGFGEFEAVEFLDSTNDSVVVYFDRHSHLPSRFETEFTDDLGIRHKQSNEFSNWHTIQGIHTPLRFDLYVDGKIKLQRFLESISFNPKIPQEYFLEPQVKKKKK